MSNARVTEEAEKNFIFPFFALSDRVAKWPHNCLQLAATNLHK